MDNNLLFVYGTLRDGMPNHPLMGGCNLVMPKAVINAKLFLGGWLPMIFEGEGRVVGEVYEIPDAEKWRRLDSLEGHPDWYQRRLVDAITGPDDPPTKVWAYFMNDHHDYPGLKYVEDGDYSKLRAGDL